MDEYQFKKKVEETIANGGGDAREIARALAAGRLSKTRMRSLLDDTVGRDMWRLLWLPASLPYYQLEGAYKGTAEQSLTKRLVFSSWHVVPRVIAGVLSYEAQRRMMQSHDSQAENTPEARERRSALLQFRQEADGLCGAKGSARQPLRARRSGFGVRKQDRAPKTHMPITVTRSNEYSRSGWRPPAGR